MASSIADGTSDSPNPTHSAGSRDSGQRIRQHRNTVTQKKCRVATKIIAPNCGMHVRSADPFCTLVVPPGTRGATIDVSVNLIFDDHGRMRALERGVSGVEVEGVLNRFDDEYDGWIAGSRVRVGRANGRRLAVLFFPGERVIVHSVWWET